MNMPFGTRLVLTLTALTALPFFSLNMFLPSLDIMADEFAVTYDVMTLAISVYLFMTGCLQLIAGPLADKYGRGLVLFLGLGLFIIASFGCALAENFTTFLMWRAVQSAVIIGAALSRAIVSDISTPKEAVRIFAYIAMGMSLAPIIGPAGGGFIADFWGWRANYWLFVGLGAGMFWLAWRNLPKATLVKSPHPSHFLRAYIVLLPTMSFWIYALIMAFSIGGFFAFISGIALVSSEQFAMSQSQIGLGMATISVGFLCGSFLASRLSGKCRLNIMILLGRGIACLGVLGCLCVLLYDENALWGLFGGAIFTGLGNGISLPSANIATMRTCTAFPSTVAGLSGALIVFFGAFFGWLVGALLALRTEALILIGFMFVLSLVALLLAFWAFWAHPLHEET